MSKFGWILAGMGAAVAASTVLPSMAGAQGAYCREYTRSVMVGNKMQEGYGTACMQPDGSWQVMNEGQQSSVPSYAQPQPAFAPAPVYQPAPVVQYYEPVPAPVAYYDEVYGYPSSSLSLSFGYSDHDWGHRRGWRGGHGRHHRGGHHHWR